MTYSDKLRLIALFFDNHPDLPTPEIQVQIYCDKEALIKAVKLPGAKKVYDTNFINIDVLIADDLKIQFYNYRSLVCEATEYETVEIPAQPAYTARKAIKWDCHPLLGPTSTEE